MMKEKRNLKVASIQMESAPGDKAANLSKVRSFAEAAALESAQIAVFPECCITGYWFLRGLSRSQILELAEPVLEGPSTRELAALAAELKMAIGAGLVELAEDGKLYNSYVVALPDGKCVRHRKIHCFVSEHMESGSEFTVFDGPSGWRAGVLTCYDNNLPENVCITALKGADVLLAPHQTGGCDLANQHAMGLVDRKKWENRESDPGPIETELRGPKGRGWLLRWLPARAHDNGIFIVFSNGVGEDGGEIRTGNAMILDPYGRILAETCKAGDDMVMAELDPVLFENCTGRGWLRTRRPELYGTLTEKTGREESTRKVRFERKPE